MGDAHRGLRSGQMRRQAITGLVVLALFSAACSPAAPSDPPLAVSATATGAPTSTATAAPTSTAAPGPTLTSAPPTSAPPASSPKPSPPWQPTTPRGEDRVVTCSGEIGPADPVAIVTFQDEKGDYGETVLRNYADIANPTTVCTGVGWFTRLLDARHVWTYVGRRDDGDNAFAVVDLPQGTYHWYRMPTDAEGQSGTVSDVAPDLLSMAWSRYDDDGGRELHVADATGDHLVYRFPSLDGRCGSPYDSNIAAYSRSGDYLYVLDQSHPQWNTLVVVGGHEVLFSVEPPADGWEGWEAGGFPLMALWSPVSDTLYYRHGSNVYEWTPDDGRTRVLAGVPWLYPTMTPDGRHLVYAIETADGTHDLYLATMPDLEGATRIATNRNHPVFLNNRQLWYRSEAGGGCVGSETRPLVYNIRSGDESPSVIVSVESIWPGTSSNH